MRVAALQMNSGPELGANLVTAERLLSEAAARGAVLAVLPENFSVMPREEHARVQLAETVADGPVQEFLARQAKANGLWIIGGTIPLRTRHPDKVRAACLVYDQHGQCVARYDKMHLFDVVISDRESYCESRYIEPGSPDNHIVTVATPAGRAGLTVCYDLRFPELYRALCQNGAELFSVPSAFTATTGRAHWEILLRARAIENIAYVIAPGQYGTHANGRETYGHSLIVGPWGEVEARVDEGAGLAVADVDIGRLQQLRARFPSLAHRRL